MKKKKKKKEIKRKIIFHLNINYFDYNIDIYVINLYSC